MTSTELIVALDNMEPAKAEECAMILKRYGVRWVKVGLELFTKAGPHFVSRLKSSGFKVFLDLKLHDIPNTVAQAALAASELEVDFLTVHMLGGVEMVTAAANALEKSNTKLLAVTLLTSHNEQYVSFLQEKLGIEASAVISRTQITQQLMLDAKKSGAHGVVCSVPDLQSSTMKQNSNTDFYFVTPGIRQKSDHVNDQKSIATIEDAISAGSTHIVMGRPILQPDKKSIEQATREVLQSLVCLNKDSGE